MTRDYDYIDDWGTDDIVVSYVKDENKQYNAHTEEPPLLSLAFFL